MTKKTQKQLAKIRENLVTVRQSKKVSQTQIGEHLGCKKDMVSKIENGIVEMRVEHLLAYAAVCGVSESTLIRG